MMSNRFTIDDLLEKQEDPFDIKPERGKLRVIKKEDRKPCGCGPSQVCWSCTEIEETEAEIEKSIYRYCSSQPNCLVVKTDTKGNRKGSRWIKSNPFERKGKQDLIICFFGRFVAVEVKKPNGKQTKEQIDYEKDVISAGGQYWVVRSLNQFKVNFQCFKLSMIK